MNKRKKILAWKNQKNINLSPQKILDVNKRGNYKIYISLDNDQVWRSVESVYDRIPVRKGQTVTISKPMLVVTS